MWESIRSSKFRFNSKPIGRYQLEDEQPFTILMDGKQKRFKPANWHRIGIGFDPGDRSRFDSFTALFAGDGKWLLLAQVQPACGDNVFGHPSGRLLSPVQAAEWCELHDVDLPQELEPTGACEFPPIGKSAVPPPSVEPAKVVRRGRLPKAEGELLRTRLLAHLREHPTLTDDPADLAQLVGVSESTARRWINEERAKYQRQKRSDED